MSDSDTTLKVLVYSDDVNTRQQVILALGRRPHPDLPEFEYVEVATEPVVIQNMDAGVIDLAIMAVPTDAVGVAATPLYSEPFALLVPADHELAGREGLPLEILVDQPLLMLDEGHCLREQTVELCRRVSAPVLGRGESQPHR